MSSSLVEIPTRASRLLSCCVFTVVHFSIFCIFCACNWFCILFFDALLYSYFIQNPHRRALSSSQEISVKMYTSSLIATLALLSSALAGKASPRDGHCNVQALTTTPSTTHFSRNSLLRDRLYRSPRRSPSQRRLDHQRRNLRHVHHDHQRRAGRDLRRDLLLGHQLRHLQTHALELRAHDLRDARGSRVRRPSDLPEPAEHVSGDRGGHPLRGR